MHILFLLMMCYVVTSLTKEAPLNGDEAKLPQIYSGQERLSITTGVK